MTTRNWHSPHDDDGTDCGLFCRPNSCLQEHRRRPSLGCGAAHQNSHPLYAAGPDQIIAGCREQTRPSISMTGKGGDCAPWDELKSAWRGRIGIESRIEVRWQTPRGRDPDWVAGAYE
jgi:hypothetical protein